MGDFWRTKKVGRPRKPDARSDEGQKKKKEGSPERLKTLSSYDGPQCARGFSTSYRENGGGEKKWDKDADGTRAISLNRILGRG